MVYTNTSIKEVIARIIRNTGTQDAQLLLNMREWIPEAMGMMKTKNALVKLYEHLHVKFHKAKLPCNVKTVLGASHCGKRLRYDLGIRPASEVKTELRATAGSVFMSRFGTSLVPPEGNQVQISELVHLNQLDYGEHTYYIENGFINTSFAKSTVTVYYNSIPLDADGLPLIPDNENYKQALYWYVRGAMIGAGHQDAVFKYDYCDMKFRIHSTRAVSEIKYSNPDQVESMHEFTRLEIPEHYFENFFSNPGIEQPIYL